MADATLAAIKRCAAGIDKFDLLAATTQLFADKSRVLQNYIDTNGNTEYKHLKIAHELGALFDAIMVQLTNMNAQYTSFRKGDWKGWMNKDPEPAALKWDKPDSYEQRLLRVVDPNYKAVVARKDRTLILTAIINGVEGAILQAKATPTPKTVAVTGGVGLGAPAPTAAELEAQARLASVGQGVGQIRSGLQGMFSRGAVPPPGPIFPPPGNAADADIDFQAETGKGVNSSASPAPSASAAGAAAVAAVGAVAAEAAEAARVAREAEAARAAAAAAAAAEAAREAAAAAARVFAVNDNVTVVSVGGRRGVVTSIQPNNTYEVRVVGQAAPRLLPAADLRPAQNGGTRRRRRNGKGKRGSRRN